MHCAVYGAVCAVWGAEKKMTFDTIKVYGLHFLQSAVKLLSSPLGVVVLGVGVCLFAVYLFEDLRR